MKSIIFNIEGMSCDHCVHSVTEALSAVPGVKRADVNLSFKRAVVTSDDDLDITAILQAVEQEGYQAAVASTS